MPELCRYPRDILFEAVRLEFSDPGEAALNTVVAAGVLGRWSEHCLYNYNRQDNLDGYDSNASRSGLLRRLILIGYTHDGGLDIYAPEQHLWQTMVEYGRLGTSDIMLTVLEHIKDIEENIRIDPSRLLMPRETKLLVDFDACLRSVADKEFLDIMRAHIQIGTYLPWSRFNLEVL